jgi:hypothetical protein
MAASDFIEQGATIMAAVSKLPLATQAPMSPYAWLWSACASSACRLSPSSWWTLRMPEGVAMRCVSAPSARALCSTPRP